MCVLVKLLVIKPLNNVLGYFLEMTGSLKKFWLNYQVRFSGSCQSY